MWLKWISMLEEFTASAKLFCQRAKRETIGNYQREKHAQPAKLPPLSCKSQSQKKLMVHLKCGRSCLVSISYLHDVSFPLSSFIISLSVVLPRSVRGEVGCSSHHGLQHWDFSGRDASRREDRVSAVSEDRWRTSGGGEAEEKLRLKWKSEEDKWGDGGTMIRVIQVLGRKKTRVNEKHEQLFCCLRSSFHLSLISLKVTIMAPNHLDPKPVALWREDIWHWADCMLLNLHLVK